MTRLVVAVALALVACKSSRTAPPFVQDSSRAIPDRSVGVTVRGHFSPPCLTIDLGQTVEWYNPSGNPINVTSASIGGAAPELFSPSLQGSAVRWRHTFSKPGRVDYVDLGASASGGLDSYEGAPTSGSGTSGTGGTVCVRAADGSGCAELCCLRAADPAQCGGRACEIPDDPDIAFGFCAAPSAPPDAAVTD